MNQNELIRHLMFRVDALEKAVYGSNPKDQTEEKVLQFIRRKGRATKNCINKGVRLIKNAEQAQATLDKLTRDGLIKRLNEKEWSIQ